MKIKRIIGTRPSNIPPSWLIFNAPRPLWGTRTWEGDFLHGVFYAAIDPDDQFAENMIRANVDDDGWLLVWVTWDYVLSWFVDYAKDNDIDPKDEFITEDVIKDCYYQNKGIEEISLVEFLINMEVDHAGH